jgi:hypothetical protein
MKKVKEKRKESLKSNYPMDNLLMKWRKLTGYIEIFKERKNEPNYITGYISNYNNGR